MAMTCMNAPLSANVKTADATAAARQAAAWCRAAFLGVSERRACAALGQHRSTQRKMPQGRDDEERLTADIIELARQYGRYGYRKILAIFACRRRARQMRAKALTFNAAKSSLSLN